MLVRWKSHVAPGYDLGRQGARLERALGHAFVNSDPAVVVVGRRDANVASVDSGPQVPERGVQPQATFGIGSGPVTDTAVRDHEEQQPRLAALDAALA